MASCWRLWLMKQNLNLIGGIHDNANGDQWAGTPFIIVVGQIK